MTEPVSLGWIAKATLVVLAITGIVWLAWQLAGVFLLFVGAVVVAVVLRASRDLIARFTPLPKKWALGTAILLLVILIAGFLVLLGSQLAGQFESLSEKLPAAIRDLGARFGLDLQEELFRAQSSWMPRVASFAPDVISAVTSAVLIIVGGVFLALDPTLYKRGGLQLLPKVHRENVGSALDNAGHALRQWLIGKILLMVVIGVATTAGLYIIGVPSAFALGFIAGLLEFIPFLGPILSFIPAAAVALSTGEANFWWVLGLYVLIQQAENNLLVPLVQQHTVDLPPVLGLFAIVALGLLFGPLGVILGIPLVIILMVLIKQLYIREVLHDDVSLPGTNDETGPSKT